jgi:hypothetical protein
MAKKRKFTGWHLTPNGWQRSDSTDNASDAIGKRPPDTLLAVLSASRGGDAPPIVTVLFRSDDREALQLAFAKFGNKPAD